jgi:ribonuclease BN (tRNA processing enzyme)
MRLIPLGSGGYIPNTRRETSSHLLLDGQTAILFDAGSGVSRLLEPPASDLLRDISSLNIVLSHYHLDHSIGLTWTLKIWPKPFQIYAPEPPFVDSTAEEALGRLISPPLFGLPLEQYPGLVTIHKVSAEGFSIGNLRLHALPQRHSGGSVGYRVESVFAYITDVDTTDSDEHVRFLENIDLAFVDAMYDEATYMQLTNYKKTRADHGYADGVANLAVRAGINRLGLVHISPEYDEERVNSMAERAKGIFSRAFIPEALQEIRL